MRASEMVNVCRDELPSFASERDLRHERHEGLHQASESALCHHGQLVSGGCTCKPRITDVHAPEEICTLTSLTGLFITTMRAFLWQYDLLVVQVAQFIKLSLYIL